MGVTSMLAQSDFEATVTFRRAEEGGRSSPAHSGYRALLRYANAYHDSFWVFEDSRTISPGETATVRVGLLHPELLAGHLRPGDQFDVYEGARVVGRGTVSRLLGLSTGRPC